MTLPKTIVQSIEHLLFWLVVVFIAFYSLFPFFWALIVSLTTDGNFNLLTHFTLENYTSLTSNSRYTFFFTSIWNSLLVCGLVTALSVFVGALASYTLGRYRFQGRYLTRYIILAMTIFPTISVLPSLLTRIKALDLPNTLLELMLAYPLFILPGIIWQLIAFFEMLPPEIEESAFVDGATPFQTFTLILLPLTLPAVATVGILSFLALLNEYLFALSFGTDSSQLLIPVALSRLSGTGASQGQLMAASIMVTLPIIVIVMFLQRAIIGETTEGAVKG